MVRLWRSSVSVSPPISAAIRRPSGFRRPAHLNERARQIVHGLQRQERNGEVKAAIRDRQTFEVADGGKKSAGPQARLGRGDPDDAVDLPAGGKRNRALRAGGAEVGGEGEAPLDQRQPLLKVLRRPGQEEVRPCVARSARPRAIEASIDEIAIKYPRRRRRRHARALCARPPLAQSSGSR